MSHCRLKIKSQMTQILRNFLYISSRKTNKQRRIDERLRLGLSARKIARVLGYSNHIGLNTYIKKRNLRAPSLAST